VDDAAAAPLAATVATIDGEDTAWLFAVEDSATLGLVHVALTRGRGGLFDRGDGIYVIGAGALRMANSSVVNASGVVFDSNEARNPVGSLVTLTEGGAMFSSSNGTSLMDGCTFRNNTVSGIGRSYGGGVMLRGASAAATESVSLVFEQCLFEDNSCEDEGGGEGGGAYIQDVVARFSGCTWRGNKATGNSDAALSRTGGGGVYVHTKFSTAASVKPMFEQCLFVSNRAGYGGGTYVGTAAPRFNNCTWRGNKVEGSDSRGGGVAVHSRLNNATSVAPVFEHCLFESNSAVALGGGACVKDAAPRFSNCIWRNNTACGGEGGGVFLYLVSAASVTITFEQCTFTGNVAMGKDGGGGALATSTTTADVPANLAFKAGECSDYSCVLPDSIASPPPAIADTFRQWTPHLVLRFYGGTTFHNNTATTASGGALSAGRGGSIVIHGSASFRNNRASLFGGAAYLKVGSASLALLGPSTWISNLAGSARGDHIYSESGGNLALGDATLQLNGDPTRVREGVVMVQAGMVSWGGESSAQCEPGYSLSASNDITTSTFQNWVLEGSSNGTAGFRSGSNCPGYYAHCDGGLSKSPDRSWAKDGFQDPQATPVFPPMLSTRVSVGCAACGATEWSYAMEPLPGLIVGAAKAERPLNRTCAACAGRMSPGIECETGVLIQQEGWWRPDAAVGFGTELFPCYSDTCVGSINASAGLPSFSAQCKTGYGGPVCTLCADGYTMQSDQCRACPHIDAQHVSFTVLVVLVMLGLCAFGYRKQKDITPCSAVIKNMLSYFQLISVMKRSFHAKWPAAYSSMLRGIELMLAWMTDLPSTACAFNVNWYDRLCIWTFGMLVIAVGIWAVGWRQQRRSSGGGGGGGGSGSKRSVSGAGHIEMRSESLPKKRLFYLAYFCYPLATPVIVSVFDCRTIAGTSYLEADYTLACEGGTYALAAAWAALWSVGFVLGFPVIVALALWQDHKALKFITNDFGPKPVQRMWEAVDLIRKLLLSSAVLFVPEVSIERIATALFISVTFQVLQVYHQPYSSKYDNRMADVAEAALSLTYFLTLLIKASPLTDDHKALDVLLIMLLLFVLFAGFMAIWMIAQQAKKEPEKTKGRQKDGLSAAVEMSEMCSKCGLARTQHTMSSSVTNPAYEEQDNKHAEKDNARITELEAELKSVKREHSKCTSARTAITAKLEEAYAVEREHSAETTKLRAELTLLKKGE
jgi:hypothetical protein